MSTKDLHVAYRPTSLDEVVGQKAVVKSIGELVEAEEIPHAFLFCGPSGCGKTTFARIIATELGCEEGSADLQEFDAATNSGVDDIRTLTETAVYQSFGGGNKMYIIDECQSLSKKAWEALLKIVEEPPPHVYFAFCTTEPTKVPATVKTRSHSYTLTDVSHDDMYGLLEEVSAQEGIDALSEDDLSTIAQASGGSPRQALVNLSKCRNVTDYQELLRLLEEPDEAGEAIELARFLGDTRGRTWKKAQEILRKLKDTNPETIRMVVSRYMQTCALGAKGEGQLVHYLQILDHFCRPANGMDEIILATFSVVFDKGDK